MELYHSEFDEFKAELERQNHHKRLANLQEWSIDVAVVKEFYANFYSPADQAPKCDRIKGHLINVDSRALSRAFLGQARFVVASSKLSKLLSLSFQYLVEFLKSWCR